MAMRNAQQDADTVIAIKGIHPELIKLGYAMPAVAVGAMVLMYLWYWPWDGDIWMMAGMIALLAIFFAVPTFYGSRISTALSRRACVRVPFRGDPIVVAWRDVRCVEHEHVHRGKGGRLPVVRIVTDGKPIRISAAQPGFWDAAMFLDQLGEEGVVERRYVDGAGVQTREQWWTRHKTPVSPI